MEFVPDMRDSISSSYYQAGTEHYRAGSGNLKMKEESLVVGKRPENT